MFSRSVAVLCLLGMAFAASAAAFTMGGFETPSRVLADPATGHLFVSNINGAPTAHDHNGYISRLDSSGKPVNMYFIRSKPEVVSLDAPKGMALLGNSLFVADIDRVHRFDKDSGKFLGTVDFSLLGAQFLNGMTVGPEDTLLVADTFGNAIYRIDPKNKNQVTVWARGPDLGQPNGLLYDAPRKRLLVTSWGTGKILFIDQKGGVFSLLPQPLRGPDGIDFDARGDLVFSAFKEGKIYRLRGWETLETLKENLLTPAGIAVDSAHRRVLVPSFNGNIVFSVPLP